MVQRICMVLKMMFLIKCLSKYPKPFFKHCFGCALNLAVGDMVKNVRIMKDSMDTTYKIFSLIKRSPKLDGVLQKIQKDISLEYPRFRVLCSARWTVRAKSMKSILDNCVALQQVWDESVDGNLQPEIICHFIGHNLVEYGTVDIFCYIS